MSSESERIGGTGSDGGLFLQQVLRKGQPWFSWCWKEDPSLGVMWSRYMRVNISYQQNADTFQHWFVRLFTLWAVLVRSESSFDVFIMFLRRTPHEDRFAHYKRTTQPVVHGQLSQDWENYLADVMRMKASVEYEIYVDYQAGRV